MSSKPSDERNGCFLDKQWCCKVCDGEIPDGHTDDCDIWKLEKKHRDFIATEYSTALIQRDALRAELAEAKREIEVLRQYGNKDCTAMADAALEAK